MYNRRLSHYVGVILSTMTISTICFSLAVAAPVQLTDASVSDLSNGLIVHVKEGYVRLQVWAPDVIRETYVADGVFPTQKSLASIGSPIKTSWHRVDLPGSVAIVTSKVQARISLISGTVSYYTSAGVPILLEDSAIKKALTPIVLPGPTPVNAYSSTDSFKIDPSESLFGLGEHQDHQGAGQSDHLDYRSTSVRLEQDYIDNLDIPLLISSKGYGVFWDNPATTTVGDASPISPIPPAQLYDADGVPGALTGQYFTGTNFDTLVATRRDSDIDFLWTTDPPLGLPHDLYSVRWTGSFKVAESGTYTFTTTGDDGVRLWIDGKQLVDDWSDHAAATDNAVVTFAANSRHTIRLDYYQNKFDALVKFGWSHAAKDEVWQSEAAHNIDYYFFYGPSIDRVIAGYRQVTGQVPMPPKWALGFWQSKEHYATQQEWLDIASTYRAKQEPIDNIVQDWFYWDPYPWGSHVMDPARYPDPAAAIKTLHDTDHMHIMISVWGKFSPSNSAGPDPNYDALNAKGYLYPDAVRTPDRFYDAFDPDARAMYWGFMRDQLMTKGFDAWWLDASEPEVNLSALRLTETGEGLGALVLNAWPLMHTTAVYQGQRQAAPNKRVFILTRSGFAGEQRNAATIWSSDITASWSVFAHQIPNALNMSLSSIPYWSSDTGGFFCNYPNGSANPEYGELFTRWFQFSAFCPIFRVHGTSTPKELWRFGPTYEPILTKYDNLRYRLMPYIYSQAWDVTHSSGTMMRALVFDFPNDIRARDLADEYLFGPSILVCPVITQGAVSRSVYLPAGTHWYDFWTGSLFDGGQSVTVPAPIETMPLLVRAGSIVPMGPFEQYTSEKPDAAIELRVYEGANGAFTLYDDEGTNYNYEKGSYSTIPIHWNELKKTLTISQRSGAYPGMQMSRVFNIVFVKPGHGAGLATSPIDRTVVYSGKSMVVSQ